MSENLTFRLFEPADIDGVLRLWKDESGWGGINEEQFYRWYVNTPFGECLTIVATDDDGDIVGQEAFVPSRILFNGEERKALRFFAPILKKDLRFGTGSPVREMFRFGMKKAAEQGFQLVYAFPAFIFFRITKFLVAPEINPEEPQNSALGCYSRSLDRYTGSERSAGLAVRPVTEFDDDFDALWHEARESFPITKGIVRDSQWLRWKLGARLTLEVRDRAEKLLGYVSIDKKSSLMVDALARTPADLETVVGAVIDRLVDVPEFGFTQIKVMRAPACDGFIRRFEFSEVDFKFAFWRYSIDPEISREMLDMSDWYVMPND